MTTVLDRERERALRTGRPCSIAMADLDRFKSINDGHGHDAGDRVLAETADRFVSALRPYDSVFRYGGEEFLFCLPETSVDIAAQVLERVLSTLRSRPIVLDSGTALTVTCSIGVAEIQREVSLSEIIIRADRALYVAKQSGRNRVSLWPTKGRPVS